MNQSRFSRERLLPALAILAVGLPAQAVVVTLDADVTAEVQELAGGAVLNSDLAFDDLDVTTPNLPLEATASLLPPTGEGLPEDRTTVAAVTTTFRDPRLTTVGPPNEFAIEAVGFSHSTSSTVTGQALAVEKRDIVFGADEVGLAENTEVLARSQFFLDGLMVLLGEPVQTALAGARCELIVRVVQERSGAESAVVLDATVVLTGQADGSASLTVNGALTADNLSTFGMNALSSAQGTFQAVSLSNLAIPYTYPANIGETFRLRAEIEARFEAPPGTGGAVVLGDRLNELSAVLDDALGSDVASYYEAGLAVGLSGLSLPLQPLVAAEQDTILEVVGEPGGIDALFNGAGCGLLGMESVLLAAGLAVAGLSGRKGL